MFEGLKIGHDITGSINDENTTGHCLRKGRGGGGYSILWHPAACFKTLHPHKQVA